MTNDHTPGRANYSLVPHPTLKDHTGYVVHIGPVALAEIHVRPYLTMAVKEENARRLAAAWNYVAGLSTEEIERTTAQEVTGALMAAMESVAARCEKLEKARHDP